MIYYEPIDGAGRLKHFYSSSETGIQGSDTG